MIWILLLILILGIVLAKLESRDPVDADITRLIRESKRHEMKPDPKRGYEFVQAGYRMPDRGCSRWNFLIIRRKP